MKSALDGEKRPDVVCYILNPGDMCDVQTFDKLPKDWARQIGVWYRADLGLLFKFDRLARQWIRVDREMMGHIQIKVLRAAGLCE